MVGYIRTAAGFILLGAGAIGTVVPVIPGVPFVAAGLALLGPDHRVTRAITSRLGRWRRRKHPPTSPEATPSGSAGTDPSPTPPWSHRRA